MTLPNLLVSGFRPGEVAVRPQAGPIEPSARGWEARPPRPVGRLRPERGRPLRPLIPRETTMTLAPTTGGRPLLALALLLALVPAAAADDPPALSPQERQRLLAERKRLSDRAAEMGNAGRVADSVAAWRGKIDTERKLFGEDSEP